MKFKWCTMCCGEIQNDCIVEFEYTGKESVIDLGDIDGLGLVYLNGAVDILNSLCGKSKEEDLSPENGFVGMAPDSAGSFVSIEYDDEYLKATMNGTEVDVEIVNHRLNRHFEATTDFNGIAEQGEIKYNTSIFTMTLIPKICDFVDKLSIFNTSTKVYLGRVAREIMHNISNINPLSISPDMRDIFDMCNKDFVLPELTPVVKCLKYATTILVSARRDVDEKGFDVEYNNSRKAIDDLLDYVRKNADKFDYPLIRINIKIDEEVRNAYGYEDEQITPRIISSLRSVLDMLARDIDLEENKDHNREGLTPGLNAKILAFDPENNTVTELDPNNLDDSIKQRIEESLENVFGDISRKMTSEGIPEDIVGSLSDFLRLIGNDDESDNETDDTMEDK